MDPAGPSSMQAVSSELVGRIAHGDSQAETELVQQFSRPVFLICLTRTRDREAARDLTQDILLAVIKALRRSQLRETDKLAAFVHGTTRNLINNYLRQRVSRREDDLTGAEALPADPVEELERLERRSLLRRALESFSAVDRQILSLSLVEGHSLAEVATRLSLSHDAVRARKSRAVRKILEKFARVSQS